MYIQMQKQKENKTVRDAFEDFIKFCKVKNLSDQTIAYYTQSYFKFTKFYNAEHYTQCITKNVVQNYILYLKSDSNLNNISVNSYVGQLRVFLNYCMDLGYVEKFKITLPKAEKKIKETYTDAELKLLLKKPNIKKCRFAEYRNWVIVNYFLATGNRVSTVTNIKIQDLDFDNNVICLKHTKNKKQQIIPMSATLALILQEYLQYRQGKMDDYLFPNQWGQKLTNNTLQRAIAKYNKSRGVLKTSCHLFRHTFAKKWILAGGDIFRLQKILGHSNVDMVRQYVNMYSADLQKDFCKFNPLDQMQGNKQTITMQGRKK